MDCMEISFYGSVIPAPFWWKVIQVCYVFFYLTLWGRTTHNMCAFRVVCVAEVCISLHILLTDFFGCCLQLGLKGIKCGNSEACSLKIPMRNHKQWLPVAGGPAGWLYIPNLNLGEGWAGGKVRKGKGEDGRRKGKRGSEKREGIGGEEKTGEVS